jgi:hypothetical protein
MIIHKHNNFRIEVTQIPYMDLDGYRQPAHLLEEVGLGNTLWYVQNKALKALLRRCPEIIENAALNEEFSTQIGSGPMEVKKFIRSTDSQKLVELGPADDFVAHMTAALSELQSYYRIEAKTQHLFWVLLQLHLGKLYQQPMNAASCLAFGYYTAAYELFESYNLYLDSFYLQAIEKDFAFRFGSACRLKDCLTRRQYEFLSMNQYEIPFNLKTT